MQSLPYCQHSSAGYFHLDGLDIWLLPGLQTRFHPQHPLVSARGDKLVPADFELGDCNSNR
jgi:hypothetical protein